LGVEDEAEEAEEAAAAAAAAEEDDADATPWSDFRERFVPTTSSSAGTAVAPRDDPNTAAPAVVDTDPNGCVVSRDRSELMISRVSLNTSSAIS